MARLYHWFFEPPFDGFLEWDSSGHERTPGDTRGQEFVKKGVDVVLPFWGETRLNSTAKCKESLLRIAMSTLRKWLICQAIILYCLSSQSDVIIHRDGQLIKGKILQNTSSGVLIQLDYGTFTYPHSFIKEIHREADSASAPELERMSSELPRWNHVVMSLSTQTWAHSAKQIPSTVIDKGILRHVPYISFRCGTDYEINVYGDPDAPAGIEIGIYRSLLGSSSAKSNCIEFIAGLLGTETERIVLRQMNRDKSAFTQGSVTIEITPQTAEDAYGGWWVSVYDEPKLDKARASESELKVVTVPAVTRAPTIADSGWSEQELKLARPYVPPSVASSRVAPIASGSSDSYSGGRVYVRGYYRKNGTYVRGHTRRR
jgi:hypothetical protein